MKQRITVEQLNELTEGQRENLREWWKPRAGDYFEALTSNPLNRVINEVNSGGNWLDTNGMGWMKQDCLPLLSIGQCIEFLNDRTAEQPLGYNDAGCFYTVQIGPRGAGEGIGSQYVGEELIDALWSAVKASL